MAQRRGKGEGGITTLKDGRYRGYISLGNGRRKYTSAYTTRKACQNAIRDLRREQEAGRDLGTPDQTITQFLATWLEQIVKRKNAPRTYASYYDMCERFIIPAIGPIRLPKLSSLLGVVVDDE